jgi:hypothetical protein
MPNLDEIMAQAKADADIASQESAAGVGGGTGSPSSAAKKAPAKKAAPKKAAASTTTAAPTALAKGAASNTAEAPANAAKSVAKKAPTTRKGPTMPTANKYLKKADEAKASRSELLAEATEAREAVFEYQDQGRSIELILQHVPDEVKSYLPEYFGSDGNRLGTPVANGTDPTLPGGTPVPGAATTEAPVGFPTGDEVLKVAGIPEAARDNIKAKSLDDSKPVWVAKIDPGHPGHVYLQVNNDTVLVTLANWERNSHKLVKDQSKTGFRRIKLSLT